MGVYEKFITVTGQKGCLFYDYMKAPELVLSLKDEKKQVISVPQGHGFHEEVAHFLRAVRGEVALECSAEDGLRVLKLVMPLYGTEVQEG